jgi:hypothetical protein
MGILGSISGWWAADGKFHGRQQLGGFRGALPFDGIGRSR